MAWLARRTAATAVVTLAADVALLLHADAKSLHVATDVLLQLAVAKSLHVTHAVQLQPAVAKSLLVILADATLVATADANSVAAC